MRVLLHGAINMSNYGDYLFAELFYNHLLDKGITPEFYSHPKYGISDYFSKYLKYLPDRQNYKEIMRSCDCLVYISGGYFTEPRSGGLFAEYKRIERYFSPAKYFIRANKPIYILGVGAGPFENRPYSRMAKSIIEYASTVTMRDEESTQYCREFSISKDIITTSDTALVIGDYLRINKGAVQRFVVDSGKKMFVLHIDSNSEVKTRISSIVRPAVIRFIKSNPDYQLYLVADGRKRASLYGEYSNMFNEVNPVVLIYDDPWELTRQIERADLIVTTKLHVGIVGSALGSSVVSFPFVPQKTKRFYKQIGESDRCVSLTDINQDMVFEMLEKYKDIRIQLPEELIAKARMNLELLPMT